MIVVIGLLYRYMRGSFQTTEENRRYVMQRDASASITNATELRRTGPLLLAQCPVDAFFDELRSVGARPMMLRQAE